MGINNMLCRGLMIGLVALVSCAPNCALDKKDTYWLASPKEMKDLDGDGKPDTVCEVYTPDGMPSERFITYGGTKKTVDLHLYYDAHHVLCSARISWTSDYGALLDSSRELSNKAELKQLEKKFEYKAQVRRAHMQTIQK